MRFTAEGAEIAELEEVRMRRTQALSRHRTNVVY